MTLRSLFGRTASTLLLLSLAACGGGGGDSSTPVTPTTYTIGGTVTGLAAGMQVVLNDNGNDPLTVNANSAFTFAKTVAANGSYAVTITTQPTGQTCSVANATGAGVTANVTNVSVVCSTVTFTIGGTVTGLAAGQQVTLNNGADAPVITADGSFTFATPVPYNGSYAVTVGTNPTGQTCTVSSGSGSGVTANVATVAVTCSTNTFTIGGAVTGLATGQQVTINNNAGDPLIVTADGAFTFATPVAFNGGYAVTVGTQPTGQTCTVSNDTGSGVVANITNVTVTCSTNTYTIGATVTGLTTGLTPDQQVTLLNGGNPLIVTATQNGTLRTFSTPVAYNGSYAVTVGTNPVGKTCTVSNGSGSGVMANITNVTVACSTNTYTIGATVTGLTTGLTPDQQVTLLNGGNSLIVTATQNGTLRTFSTPVAYNGSYAVTVGTNPVGKTCTVSNGSGSGVVANITNVTVTCSTNTYTIGATVTGLTTGLTPDQQVTLLNGGNSLIVTATQNGTLRTFSTPVAYNGSYAVTVGTNPVGKTCTVSNGSGSGVVANITNVTVTCSTNTYTIGATVTGLTTGLTPDQQVTLLNGGNSLIVTATQNGTLRTFSTPVAYNGSYAVTVGTNPVGKTCTVSNGSGSGVVANITNVTVTCSTNTYTIGATVTGLTTGLTPDQQVTLLNGGNSLIVTATQNGTLRTFSTPVAYNGSYAVTVGTNPVGKTCTVSNGSGSGVVANITNVTVTCSTSTFTIGGTISGLVGTQQVTLNNGAGGGGNSVTSSANGAFEFTTPVAYDTGYTVTVGTQPTAEFCRITGGTGSNVTANVTSVSISCRPATVYVTNSTDSTVSQYSVDVDTGALTSLGAAVSTGVGSVPRSVTVDPSGRYAYVANEGTNDVAQFTIGANGALTAMAPPTVAAQSSPWGVVVHPSGLYAYVTNKGSDTVSQYNIGAGGALTAMTNQTAPAVDHPFGITISPNGLYAYVANFGTGGVPGTTVSQYTFAAGELVPMTAPDDVVVTGSGASGPLSVAVDPLGVYAYVTNYFDETVRQFTVGAGGKLTASGTPDVATGADGTGPWPVALSPNGLYAYWASTYTNSISQCTFGAGGALSCNAGATATSGAAPLFVVVDPSNRFVYVTNSGDATVSQYSIGGGGVLTSLGAATAPTGAGPYSIATTR